MRVRIKLGEETFEAIRRGAVMELHEIYEYARAEVQQALAGYGVDRGDD